MFCPECGNKIEDDSRFCEHCGNNIETDIPKEINTQNDKSAPVLTCPDCGKSIPDDSKFCEYCGKNIDTDISREVSIKKNEPVPNSIASSDVPEEQQSPKVEYTTCRNCGDKIEGSSEYCSICQNIIAMRNKKATPEQTTTVTPKGKPVTSIVVIGSVFLLLLIGLFFTDLIPAFNAYKEKTNSSSNEQAKKIVDMTTTPQTPKSKDMHLITSSGIGDIRLGISLNEAKTMIPDARLERCTDADDVALVCVKIGGEELMQLHADEENSEAPINWAKNISVIQTFNPACHTEEGIHPGSLVLEVEKILGKTKIIKIGPTEQRQYIEFINQPSWIIFRLDYTGIFEDGSSQTTRFDPKGKILSIAVKK